MPDKHRVVQLRRGTTLEHQTFIGAAGEVTVDTDKWSAVVHDGITEGGYPLKVEAVEYDRIRYLTMRAAITQYGIPSLGFSALNNAPVPIAIIEENGIVTGAAAFQVGQSIQDHFMLPSDWVPPLDLEILWRSSQIIGEVSWEVEICGVPIGQTISNAVFNAPSTIVAQVGDGLAFQLVTTTFTNLNVTGAEPEGELFFRITRTSDSLDDVAEMISLRFAVLVRGK